MIKTIPRNFQGILWSKKVENLDLEKDKNYLVHQILAYGSLKEIKWLFKVFPKKTVVKTFIEFSKKTYSPPAFNFVKNFILGLKDKKIKQKDYVKTVF